MNFRIIIVLIFLSLDIIYCDDVIIKYRGNDFQDIILKSILSNGKILERNYTKYGLLSYLNETKAELVRKVLSDVGGEINSVRNFFRDAAADDRTLSLTQPENSQLKVKNQIPILLKHSLVKAKHPQSDYDIIKKILIKDLNHTTLPNDQANVHQRNLSSSYVSVKIANDARNNSIAKVRDVSSTNMTQYIKSNLNITNKTQNFPMKKELPQTKNALNSSINNTLIDSASKPNKKKYNPKILTNNHQNISSVKEIQPTKMNVQNSSIRVISSRHKDKNMKFINVKFMALKYDFDEAVKYCISRNENQHGEMISIREKHEAQWLIRTVKPIGDEYYWIGGKLLSLEPQATKGTYRVKWADGSFTQIRPSFRSLKTKQLLERDKMLCISMNFHIGLWNFDDCSKKLGFVCLTKTDNS